VATTRFGCSTTAALFCFTEPTLFSAKVLNFILLSLLQLDVGLSLLAILVITEFDFNGSSLAVNDPFPILLRLPSNEGKAIVRSSILRVARSESLFSSVSTLST
jgi:hypothetical protein